MTQSNDQEEIANKLAQERHKAYCAEREAGNIVDAPVVSEELDNRIVTDGGQNVPRTETLPAQQIVPADVTAVESSPVTVNSGILGADTVISAKIEESKPKPTIGKSLGKIFRNNNGE